MADDPLDGWRETLAEDRQRAAVMPSGPAKSLLNKKLREIEVILQALRTLPSNDPFRDRVELLARRMEETQSIDTQRPADILAEFGACVKENKNPNWALRGGG
jgi:hypothetical protein